MVTFLFLIKDGLNADRMIIHDLKPEMDYLWNHHFNYNEFKDIDCIQCMYRTYNNKKYTPASYYRDTLKRDRNYSLCELKIYKNGEYKIIKHYNKYKDYPAPKY